MRVKAACAVHLPIVDAPEDLQPAVDTLDRGATIVEPLELLGRPRDAGETPQVDLLLDAHGQAVVTFAVAGSLAGTSEALMTRRTAIFERATLRFVADVRHGVS